MICDWWFWILDCWIFESGNIWFWNVRVWNSGIGDFWFGDLGFLDLGFAICDSGFWKVGFWKVGFWNLGLLDFGMLDFGILDFGSQRKHGVTWQRSTMIPSQRSKIQNTPFQTFQYPPLEGQWFQTLSSWGYLVSWFQLTPHGLELSQGASPSPAKRVRERHCHMDRQEWVGKTIGPQRPIPPSNPGSLPSKSWLWALGQILGEEPPCDFFTWKNYELMRLRHSSMESSNRFLYCPNVMRILFFRGSSKLRLVMAVISFLSSLPYFKMKPKHLIWNDHTGRS